MKTVWNMLSFLAVVNLLAIVMLAVWLWRSDRLDRGRLERVRQIFAVTVADEAAAEKAARVAEEAARAAGPPADPLLTGAAQVGQASRVHEQEMLAAGRLASQRRLLQAALAEQIGALEATQEDLRKSLESEAGEPDGDARADAQFAKAVKHLEAVPPRQAKRILAELVRSGDMDQAVAYLDAMSPRGAAKVLREFKTDAETALATELLERVRRLGVSEDPKEPTGDAQPALTTPERDPAGPRTGGPAGP